MLQLYVLASLAVLGFYMNKRDVQKSSYNLQYHKGDTPSMNNLYESHHVDAVNDEVRRRNESMYVKSLDPQSTGVIPREFANTPKDAAVMSRLAGVEIPMNDYKHNNMVPFFGGSLKQNMKEEASQNILERYTGVNTKPPKREVVCMGDLKKDAGNVFGNGADSYEEQYQRMEASRMKTNQLPFEQVRVGPGLNKGYSAAPSGGFQQPETREYVDYKNVDELRVATKPKLTYEGRTVDGLHTSLPGELGEVRKNRIETFAEHGPDRLFTTTGAYVKETGRPEVNLKYTTRKDTTKEYAGIPYENRATKSRAAVKEPNRQQLGEYGVRNAALDDYGAGEKDDYGKGNIMVYTNERDVTTTRTYQGNVTSLVKSIVAPLLDLARNSTKEYTISHARTFGNMSIQIPSKATMYDPNDVARTTIKETLIHDTHTGNLKGPQKLTTYDPDEVARTTMRETMPEGDSGLNLTGQRKGKAYDPDDVTRTTMKETLIEAERDGNLDGLPKAGAYESTEYDARLTQKQFLSDNDYMGGFYRGNQDGYLVAEVDAKLTQKQFLSDNDYVGAAASSDKKNMSYEDMYNADVNDVKEMVLRGRDPTKTGQKSFVSKTDVRMDIRKLECDQRATRTFNNRDHVVSAIPSKNMVEITHEKPVYRQDDRLDMAILKAFKENPYTKPLDSVAPY